MGQSVTVGGTPATATGQQADFINVNGYQSGAVRLLTVANGNLGIQTASPSANLQVDQATTGPSVVSTNATTTLSGNAYTQFLNTFKVNDTVTVAGETRTISAIASNSSLTVSAAFTTTLSNQTYTLVGGNRFNVLGNGNVGIGTNAPTARLQVYKDVNNHAEFTGGDLAITSFNSSTPVITLTASAQPNGVQADNLNFNGYQGGTTRLLTSSYGDFGIQTSAPAANLQVDQATTGPGVVNTSGTTTLAGSQTQFLNTFKVGDAITVSGETVRTITAIASNSSLTVNAAFSTTATNLTYTLTGGTRLVVQGNGNIGIGNATPTNKLSVNALATSNASTLLAQVAVSTGAAGNIGQIIQGSAGQTGDLLQAQNSTGTVLASIGASGLLTSVGLTNTGATLNTALALTNFATGGVIGTAATTVDIYTSITVNQTTASQTLTLPNPTSTTAGRLLYLSNIGTASFNILGSPLKSGATATTFWNGTAWTFAGADGASILNQSTSTQTANFNIQSAAATTIGAVIQGATGQTADLLQLQNSSALSLAKFDANGGLTVSANTNILVGSATNGTAATSGLSVTGQKGGNTTGITGQTAGAGASLTFIGGAGGDASAGSNRANGGSITFQGGAPGFGTGSNGAYGSILLQQTSGNVGIASDATQGLLDVGGTSANATGLMFRTTLTNTVSNILGIAVIPTLQAGNNLQAIGEYIAPTFATTAGSTITSARGISIDPAVKTGTGTITNYMGLFINIPGTTATNNFALYVSGGKSYFGGNIGVGIINPNYSIDVAGGDINTSAYYRQGGTIVVNTITGTNNTFVGSSAGNVTTTGVGNTATGVGSLQSLTTGNQNTATGFAALGSNAGGTNNAALGYNAGNGNASGNNNTYVGFSTGYQDAVNTAFTTGAALQNATAIGAYAQVQASNSIVLGSVDNLTKVGIGTTVPLNTLSVSPVDQNSTTNTATQSTNTITAAVGTPFTAAMVGEQFIFANGTSAGTITGFTSSTVITVSVSQTVTPAQKFRTHFIGLQVTSAGNVGIGTAATTANLLVKDSSSNVTLLQSAVTGLTVNGTSPLNNGGGVNYITGNISDDGSASLQGGNSFVTNASAPASANSAAIFGNILGLYTDASKTINFTGDLFGGIGQLIMRGGLSTASGNSYGLLGKVQNNGSPTGLIANAIGVAGTFQFDNATPVTNAYALRAMGAQSGSSAAVVNAYGLYIDNVNYGTTKNYSIYSAGGTNYLAGNLGIGAVVNATPQASLDVESSTNSGITALVVQTSTSGNDVLRVTVSGANVNQSFSAGTEASATAQSPVVSVATTKLDPSRIVSVVRVGNNLYARIGTTFGTSITYGTEVSMGTTGLGTAVSVSVTALSSSSFVAVWGDATATTSVYAVVCTVTAPTAISCGSVTQAAATVNHFTLNLAVTALSSTSFVVAFADYDGFAVVSSLQEIAATVSGTTITFGSAVSLGAASSSAANNAYGVRVQALSSTTTVAAYKNSSGYPTTVASTISGTTITLGAPVVASNGPTYSIYSMDLQPLTSTTFAFGYSTAASPSATLVSGTVSGTSINFSPAVTVSGVTTISYIALAPLSSTSVSVHYAVAGGITMHNQVATVTGYGFTFGPDTTKTVTTVTAGNTSGSQIAAVALDANTFYVEYEASSIARGYVGVLQSGTLGSTTKANQAFTVTNKGETYLRVADASSTNAFQVQSASGATLLNVDTANSSVAVNGNFGVGTAAPAFNADIQGSQASTYVARIKNTSNSTTSSGLLIDLGNRTGIGTGGNIFVGFSSNGTVAGKIQTTDASTVTYSTTGADYAEYFQAKQDELPKPGELVSLAGGSTNAVVRTQNNAPMGIISTNPGFIGNGPICQVNDNNCDSDYQKYNVLVSLTGQVPVKVSVANGIINAGDPITSSALAGVGQKATTAGRIVGYALGSTNVDGTVQVLINPGYYNPTDGNHIQADSATLNNLTVNGAMDAESINVGGLATIKTLNVTGSATIGGNLLVSGDLTVAGTTKLAILIVSGHITSAGDAPQLAVGTAAGTSTISQPAPIASVDGTDTAGTITISSGQTITDAGILAQLTFAKAYAVNSKIKVALTPTSEHALDIRVYIEKTDTGFKIITRDKLTPSTSYSFDYIVIGAQQVTAK